MQLFVDTAAVSETVALANTGLVHGLTARPGSFSCVERKGEIGSIPGIVQGDRGSAYRKTALPARHQAPFPAGGRVPGQVFP